jgi:hypothetical protein
LDVFLFKTDSGGNLVWSKTIGGSGDDVGRSFQQTADGGTIITGYTKSSGAGEADVYLVKTDVNRNVLWSKTYGSNLIDDGASVYQTTDGGYVIVGTTQHDQQNSDVYLIKTDAGGDALWTRTIGGDRAEGGSSVLQTTDGGYVIAGWAYPSAASFVDAYLIRTNTNGDTLWTKTFGGSGEDGGLDVHMTTDNGFVVSGYTNSFGAGPRVYLIKVDSVGNTLWTRTLGGTYDLGYSVRQTSDGGYVVAGSSYVGSFTSAFLLKTDAGGNLVWRRTFGGRQYDYAQSVLLAPDGGYVVTGYGSSFGDGSNDAFVIKTDADGNLWSR